MFVSIPLHKPTFVCVDMGDPLPLLTLVAPKDTPMQLRDIVEDVIQRKVTQWNDDAVVLTRELARLKADLQYFEDQEDTLAHVRNCKTTAKRVAMVSQALENMRNENATGEHQNKLDLMIQKFIELSAAAKAARKKELLEASSNTMRFVPTFFSGSARPEPTVGDKAGPTSGGAGPGGSGTGVGVQPTLPSDITGANFLQLLQATPDLTTRFRIELEVTFELAPHPAELLPFDMCPKHKTLLHHDTNPQQLICPVEGCTHFKRFVDMTSATLAYGREVQFQRFKYRPSSHLDDIMKYAEASENFVVPPAALYNVAAQLYARGFRKPEEITIPMVREACKLAKPKVKMDYTVQIYCRLTGYAARRFTPYMKEHMRAMFQAAEGPFRKHVAGTRKNNLSFAFTLRKYLEFLGYWEFVEALSMLRGLPNVNKHDTITAHVFHDMGWNFVCTMPPEGIPYTGLPPEEPTLDAALDAGPQPTAETSGALEPTTVAQ